MQAGAGRLVEALAGGAVRDLCHDELAGLAVAVRAVQARLDAVLLTVIGEVDARGSFVHDGALTAGAWLRMTTRAAPGEAAAAVRTARALRTGVLPGTAAALAAGQISGRHAQLIADRSTHAPAGAVALLEPEVLAVARTADVRAVASVMTAFAHAIDPDAADEAALRRLDRRGLTLAPTLDGSMALTGLADEVSGSLIATAIATATPPVTGDTRSPAQIRLDGLVEIAKRYLEGPDAPTRGGGHPHLLVTVDQHTLRGEHPDPDRTGQDRDPGQHRQPGRPGQPDRPGDAPAGSPGATLSWIGPITGATARRIGCDAQHTRVVIGPDGDVLDTHTERRFFTLAQRRAMIARDGDRCATPYCDRQVLWADGHHLTPVENGGPTTTDNGALPCAGHHQLLHEGHWHLHRLPDGRYTLSHPDGRVIGPEPHPPGHNRPPPPQRE